MDPMRTPRLDTTEETEKVKGECQLMGAFFDMIDEIPAAWFVGTLLATALACWAIEIYLRPRKEWWQE